MAREHDAHPHRHASGWVPGTGARMALGLLCLLALVTPVLIIGSQRRLGEAENALYEANCAKASSAALSSIGWLDVRPEPYEIVGFCDLRRGQPQAGGVGDARGGQATTPAAGRRITRSRSHRPRRASTRAARPTGRCAWTRMSRSPGRRPSS